MVRNLFLVGIGGAAGSMLRYGITLFVGRFWTQPFPLATLLINLAGSLAIGLLFGLSVRHGWAGGAAWLLLATGLCGGFTTFSAFALENVRLLSDGLTLKAVLYMAATLAGGLLLCWTGILLAR